MPRKRTYFAKSGRTKGIGATERFNRKGQKLGIGFKTGRAKRIRGRGHK